MQTYFDNLIAPECINQNWMDMTLFQEVKSERIRYLRMGVEWMYSEMELCSYKPICRKLFEFVDVHCLKAYFLGIAPGLAEDTELVRKLGFWGPGSMRDSSITRPKDLEFDIPLYTKKDERIRLGMLRAVDVDSIEKLLLSSVLCQQMYILIRPDAEIEYVTEKLQDVIIQCESNEGFDQGKLIRLLVDLGFVVVIEDGYVHDNGRAEFHSFWNENLIQFG